MKLDESFYQRTDVTLVARELLGKVLVTRINRRITSGMIVETEAYAHTEKGCHAYLNRMTPRNEVMFRAGGHTYVYLCYGIHHLFNVVTGDEGTGDAVLIRALQPIDGIKHMIERTGAAGPKRITSGPGKLTMAMGIDRNLNGKFLTGTQVWIEERGLAVPKNTINAGPRIGIDYAGADAALPWRFTIRENEWISR